MDPVAILKTLLHQLAMPSCRWGHKWGCWAAQGQYNTRTGAIIDGPIELQDITTFRKALVQQRKCLVCDYIELDTKVINLYGK